MCIKCIMNVKCMCIYFIGTRQFIDLRGILIGQLAVYKCYCNRNLTLSVTVVTVLDNHPKFQFYFKKGSSKTFPMSVEPMSR